MTEAKKQNESTETALMEGWYWVTIDDDKTPVIAHLTAWGGWWLTGLECDTEMAGLHVDVISERLMPPNEHKMEVAAD